jgi:hypothetical protein
MIVLLQPGQTEYTATEEQKPVKAGQKDFFLEQAAELLRSATFYRERAQQFKRFMKSPLWLSAMIPLALRLSKHPLSLRAAPNRSYRRH